MAALPGAVLATEVAAMPTLDAAVARLEPTVYGEHMLRSDTLPELERTVAATVLWRLRLLAGWLPFGGSVRIRALAGWFEVRVIEERLGVLSGAVMPARYEMGRLGTVARSVAAAPTIDALRQVLARSTWGEPRSMALADVHAHLTARWAERVRTEVPEAQGWADAAVSLAAARDATAGRPPRFGTAHAPTSAHGAAELWVAEERWWTSVAAGARRMLLSRIGTPEVVIGACGLLAVDAHRMHAALEMAARGGGALEADDAAA